MHSTLPKDFSVANRELSEIHLKIHNGATITWVTALLDVRLDQISGWHIRNA